MKAKRAAAWAVMYAVSLVFFEAVLFGNRKDVPVGEWMFWVAVIVTVVWAMLAGFWWALSVLAYDDA